MTALAMVSATKTNASASQVSMVKTVLWLWLVVEVVTVLNQTMEVSVLQWVMEKESVNAMKTDLVTTVN
jgi:hypothetical protein